MLRAHVIHIFGPQLKSFNYTPIKDSERDAVEHLFNCGKYAGLADGGSEGGAINGVGGASGLTV